MLKKFFIIGASLFVLLIITALLVSRLGYGGIKFSNGTYLGYSSNLQQWYFAEYRNMPVGIDGPYVNRQGDHYLVQYVESDADNNNVVINETSSGRVRVRVDNDDKTEFFVNIQPTHSRSKLVFEQPEKLLALSDIEGNFEAFTKLLIANNVIDRQFNWIYGRAHLILLGDMVDRGQNVLPVLWLIYKLEAEARAVGGDVHFVLGNHERYLIDGRMKSAQRKYEGTYSALNTNGEELYSDATEIGRWIRSKPVVVKIGETLFMHAGISPSVLALRPSIETIDTEATENISIGNSIMRNHPDSLLHGAAGILFYRGFADDMSQHSLGPKASEEHVDAVLAHFDVNKIAIGHTLVPTISYDYNQKILRVDVPHSRGVSEALLYDSGDWFKADDLGNIEKIKQIAPQ
ncbi:metallophosphoesterase [Glaciecola siphonariae]|uniref:Metallophosphoesterase n=1 Tax=Glaciecola siphonariae TaxID=521012 RepID=A0ABV9LUN1_9ALTE